MELIGYCLGFSDARDHGNVLFLYCILQKTMISLQPTALLQPLVVLLKRL